MTTSRNLIVIDPEETIRDILREYFSEFGYEVSLAQNTSEGLDFLNAGTASVLLVDASPSPRDSMEAVDKLRAARPGVRVVLITGCPTLGGIIEALRHGVFDIIIKPFRLGDLKETIERAARPSAEEAACEAIREKLTLLEKLIEENGIELPYRDRTDGERQPEIESGPDGETIRKRFRLSAGEEIATVGDS
jgi:DNA-binding NtrC family response regulator